MRVTSRVSYLRERGYSADQKLPNCFAAEFLAHVYRRLLSLGSSPGSVLLDMAKEPSQISNRGQS